MSDAVRVTRALLAIQQLLQEQVPGDVENACRKAALELASWQRALAQSERTEDPFGNQS